jgi:hypothetical protein
VKYIGACELAKPCEAELLVKVWIGDVLELAALVDWVESVDR